ncbi:MAG: endonuclease/exonuclease/phosphatase family protein [Blastochloris sp.]|nr:endonuclease/exonuclease/phosphatase family protein [Blastochloris sp.]
MERPTYIPSLSGLLHAFFQIGAWGLVFVTLFSFLDSFFWLADLLGNLRIQYSLASLLLLATSLCLRRQLWALVGTALLLLNLAPIGLSLLPNSSTQVPPQSSAPLKVLVLNVLTQNRNSQAVKNYLLQENPDVIALIEVDETWARQLREFSRAWPYQIAELRPDNFGIWILSRHPFSEADILHDPLTRIPSLRVRLAHPPSLVIFATHPLPPMTPHQSHLRNRHLDQVANWVREETHPVILLTDLNATPWTHGYRRFTQASGLSAFLFERSLRPSYSHNSPLFGIPIDFIMARGVQLRNFRIGPDVGSDHLGLSAQVFFPLPPPP